jgi:hypothetical protein
MYQCHGQADHWLCGRNGLRFPQGRLAPGRGRGRGDRCHEVMKKGVSDHSDVAVPLRSERGSDAHRTLGGKYGAVMVYEGVAEADRVVRQNRHAPPPPRPVLTPCTLFLLAPFQRACRAFGHVLPYFLRLVQRNRNTVAGGCNDACYDQRLTVRDYERPIPKRDTRQFTTI